MDLFSTEKSQEPIKIQLEGADLIYYPSFFSSEAADRYFKYIMCETLWQQDIIKLFGKTHLQPRLTALYGDENSTYSYSGIRMFPKPFSKVLKEIKSKIEAEVHLRFTSVLLNQYRDGSDSNGWHSDDEKELGINPAIASISLGAERVFQLRNKKDKNLKKKITLAHGSLLLMKGTTQHFWQHQIPKTKKDIAPRINLTFRVIAS